MAHAQRTATQAEELVAPMEGHLSITNVEWRVDVLLASQSLSRIGVPVIALTLEYSDGRIATYRLSQEELHQWRFTLAKVVRDIGYLDKKQAPAKMVAAAFRRYNDGDADDANDRV